jgi:hypothetical protein
VKVSVVGGNWLEVRYPSATASPRFWPSGQLAGRRSAPSAYYRFRPCLGLSCAWPCGFWVARVCVRVWSELRPVRFRKRCSLAAWRVAGGSTFSSRLRAARSCHMCDIEQRRSAGGSRRETITINHKRLQPVRSPNSPNTGSVLMLNDPNTTPVRARARSVPYEERQMTAHQWVLVPLSPSLVTSLARTNTSRTMAQSGREHTHAPLGH